MLLVCSHTTEESNVRWLLWTGSLHASTQLDLQSDILLKQQHQQHHQQRPSGPDPILPELSSIRSTWP
jgi:hypothetical protein